MEALPSDRRPPDVDRLRTPRQEVTSSLGNKNSQFKTFCCCWFLVFFFFWRQDFRVALAILYSIDKAGPTQRSACLCLLSTGIKGEHCCYHPQQFRIVRHFGKEMGTVKSLSPAVFSSLWAGVPILM